MKRIFLIIGLLLIGIIGVASADCDGAGVIVCDLRDLNGIILSDGDDDLTIAKGARVRSDIGYGVDAGYGNDRVVNNGDISARVRGLYGDTGNDTLINTGTIRDGDSGIYGGIGNDYLENSGTITARQNGIEASDVDAYGDFDIVVNSGTIHATSSHGIFSTGQVTNSGRVNARRDGIIGTNITNTGRVISYGGTGLRGDFTDDVIINYGSTQGVVGIGGLDGFDRIENYGSVTGGIEGGSGDDTIIWYDNSSVSGIINCGTEFDTLIFAHTVPANDLAILNEFIASLDFNDLNFNLNTITINRKTYSWQFCETVISQMTPR